MKVKAIVSFCGTLSMAKGEIREVTDKAVLVDLMKAGYVVAAEPPVEEPAAAAVKAEAPKRGSRKKAVSAT